MASSGDDNLEEMLCTSTATLEEPTTVSEMEIIHEEVLCTSTATLDQPTSVSEMEIALDESTTESSTLQGLLEQSEQINENSFHEVVIPEPSEQETPCIDEDLMIALADCSDMDPEEALAKMHSCEGEIIKEPEGLLKELDKLEQLAAESVREIEGYTRRRRAAGLLYRGTLKRYKKYKEEMRDQENSCVSKATSSATKEAFPGDTSDLLKTLSDHVADSDNSNSSLRKNDADSTNELLETLTGDAVYSDVSDTEPTNEPTNTQPGNKVKYNTSVGKISHAEKIIKCNNSGGEGLNKTSTPAILLSASNNALNSVNDGIEIHLQEGISTVECVTSTDDPDFNNDICYVTEEEVNSTEQTEPISETLFLEEQHGSRPVEQSNNVDENSATMTEFLVPRSISVSDSNHRIEKSRGLKSRRSNTAVRKKRISVADNAKVVGASPSAAQVKNMSKTEKRALKRNSEKLRSQESPSSITLPIDQFLSFLKSGDFTLVEEPGVHEKIAALKSDNLQRVRKPSKGRRKQSLKVRKQSPPEEESTVEPSTPVEKKSRGKALKRGSILKRTSARQKMLNQEQSFSLQSISTEPLTPLLEHPAILEQTTISQQIPQRSSTRTLTPIQTRTSNQPRTPKLTPLQRTSTQQPTPNLMLNPFHQKYKKYLPITSHLQPLPKKICEIMFPKEKITAETACPNEGPPQFSFDVLKSNAKSIALPTTLWCCQNEFFDKHVAFVRVSANILESATADKAILFLHNSLVPHVYLKGKFTDLPTMRLRNLEDVAEFIDRVHRVAFCGGTGITQRPYFKNCYGYVDVPNTNGRCSLCLEERRRLLAMQIMKLKERLAHMSADENEITE